MALLELSFADKAKLREEGRSFDCSTCTLQTLRRCREPREDFESGKDHGPWPMYVQKGGNLYGFCPGKATWDPETVSLYDLLTVIAETGQLLEAGGISAQPPWLIDHLAWFLPAYNTQRFLSNLQLAFGGDGKAKADTKGTQPAADVAKGRVAI